MHRRGLVSIFLSSTPKSDNRLPFYAGGRVGEAEKAVLPFKISVSSEELVIILAC